MDSSEGLGERKRRLFRDEPCALKARSPGVAEWAERTHWRNAKKLAQMILAEKVMRYGREPLSLGRKVLNLLTHSVVRPVGAYPSNLFRP